MSIETTMIIQQIKVERFKIHKYWNIMVIMLGITNMVGYRHKYKLSFGICRYHVVQDTANTIVRNRK